ncbi:MAG TPA: lysine--tRNA ligase [Saprospiraceae bacterium]|nr:lysine--tRNA ligase [Saprospiraceae bacterium]
MSQHELSEQELARRESLVKIRELGIDPYPAEQFVVSNTAVEIKLDYKEEVLEDGTKNRLNFQEVSLAGRLMNAREAGKAMFMNLQDSSGIIQLYLRREELSEGEDSTFFDQLIKKLLDIGDFIGVTGYAFITKTGETTIHVKSLKLLSKSLKPLPVVKVDAEGNVHDAINDPEFRYRQRYVDLTVNPAIKEIFLKRTKMVNTIRQFLNDHGGIEVDTPVLQNIPGGAAAKPFITHHNALDSTFYLRVANELYLKRLIVGGYDFVYEFSRNFRNEGMDRTHNPEFTVLEFYVAYKDYFWMMDFTEQLMEKVAIATNGSTELQVGDNTISFKAPFKRISIFEAVLEHTGIDISEMNEEQLREVCKKHRIEIDPSMGKGKLIDEIFGETSEKKYIQPTFIMDYPEEMSPLTKKHRTKKGLVERFELMINGKEIANAYSELNDPIDQRERFEEQVKLMERGDDEAMFIDHDFLRALEYGMPPTSGIGFGIDRMAMLMTNQSSIQEVLFFPQMKPEKSNN